MLFLTEVQNTQPDYVALAMVVVFVIIVAIFVVRKKTAKKAEVAPAPVAVPAEMPVAPGVAGQVKIHNVEPKTAAMLMAIVAEKTGKPLNELRFISIKEVQ